MELLKKKLIMIAAAEKAQRDLAKAVAEEFGFSTMAIDRSESILILLAEAKKDCALILLAPRLPEVDAPALLQKLKTSADPIERQIPVVGFASVPVAGVSEQCLAAGIDDFYDGPLSATVLMDLIAKWTKEQS